MGVKERLMAFKDNKKKINYLYAAVSVAACYLTLRQLAGQVSESIRMICYILLIFSLFRLEMNTEKVYSVFSKPWHRTLLFLLEAYSAFAAAGMYVLDSSVEYETVYADIVYITLAYVWVRPLVISFLAVLLSLEDKSGADDGRKVNLSARLGLVCLVLLPCMLFLIAFNPAITSPDSEFCFDMAHRIWEPGVSMQDWHPPFYVFVLSVLVKVWDSVTFIIIVQDIYFAVVFVYAVLYFYSRGVSKRLLTVIYCFIAFGAGNIIQLVTLWKDIPYMVSIMWLTMLLVKYVLDKEAYEKRLSWYIQMITALVFTALFRQNGILPALAVIVLLPFAARVSKRMLVVSISSICLLLLIKYPLYHVMEVDAVPGLKFMSLANDIMYSYYCGCSMSEEAMEMVNKLTWNEPDNFNYNVSYVAYSNIEELGGYTTAEFIRIYVENALRNPKSAVMAGLIRNSDIWSIVRPADEAAGCVNYLGERISYPENVYPFRHTNMLTLKLTSICGWIRDNSVLFILYWRTGIYNLLIILMAGIIFLKIGRKGWMLCLMPFVPIIMNIFALLASSGWSDYRYFWPSMTVSLLLLCYYTLIKRRLFQAKAADGGQVLDIHRVNLIVSFLGLCMLAYSAKYAFPNYLADRNDALRAQQGIDGYLELLNYSRYEAVIEVRNASILEIPRYRNLFQSLGTDVDAIDTKEISDTIETRGQLDDNYVFVIGQNDSDILADFYVSRSTGQSTAATPQENNGAGDEPDSSTDIRVWVRDQKSKEVIDLAEFSYEIEDGVLQTMRAEHFGL